MFQSPNFLMFAAKSVSGGGAEASFFVFFFFFRVMLSGKVCNQNPFSGSREGNFHCEIWRRWLSEAALCRLSLNPDP